MSLDLVAYGDDPSPVAIADLISRCRARGYECRVIRDDDDDDDANDSSHAVSDGFLASDDVLVAWRRSAPEAPSAERAAATADWKVIGELEERGAIGACAIEFSDNPEEFNNPQDWAQLEEMYGPGYAAARKASRVCWYIRLQAGRNRLSAQLAQAVLRSLLELRGGMFEDPQSCTFQLVRRGEVT